MNSNEGIVKYIMLSVFLIFLGACNPIPEQTNMIINSSLNKAEFEKVIRFYKKKGDQHKLEAALFLIDNMAGKQSLDSASLQPFSGVFEWLDSLYRVKGINMVDIRQEWDAHIGGSANTSDYSFQFDTDHLTSDFLIENIEYAFLAWEQIKAYHSISFEQFCEYILPYAVYSEIRLQWRKWLAASGILNSTSHAKDIITRAKEINQSLTWFRLDYTYFNDYPGAIALDKLYQSRFGTCIHYDQLSVYYNRAAGIPVALDFTPQFADRSGGHRWTAVIDQDNQTFSYSTCYIEPIKGQKLFEGKIAKVYRAMYGKQPQSLVSLNQNRETIPPLLQNDFIIDVTGHYPPCSQVHLELTPAPSPTRFVYLCVFDNANWQAIAWSELKNGNIAQFSDVRRGIVFLPAYYINNQYVPAGQPFELTKEGDIKTILLEKSKLQDMVLKRKYPLLRRITMFATYMIGGKFQGANQRDFSDAKDLFEIETCPHQGWNKIAINSISSYRYIRYLAPAYSWGSIAEIACFDTNRNAISLAGEVFGTPGIDPQHSAAAVFDGNPETWFETEALHESYVAIDLGHSRRIKELHFIPRTDNNGIEAGNIYELVYWDRKWVSCGIQKATDDELVYKNVPSEGLYLLHNLTKGREERIFTYVDSKQIWW